MKILHVEDSESDAELVRMELQRSGMNCQVDRVETREDFTNSLKRHEFDLILSDCALPQFTGQEALKISRSLKPHIPFVFVSGTMGEEVAIDSLREGATDYVLKERLSRLGPAVRRALLEAEEQKNNELMAQTLRHSRRLEAVGTLAGGMARDFNNLLNIIVGHASLLKEPSVSETRRRQIADTILQAGERGGLLVERLQAFARRSEGHFTLIDLNERVEFVVGMHQKTLLRPIHWELCLPEDLPKTYGDSSQIARILSNLFTNAQEAMLEGGKITVTTSVIPGRGLRNDEAKSNSNPYLCLEIKDTGHGMDEEGLRHVFEPFYSTKTLGHGIGLGLPEVYGLMKSHQGFVDIRSRKGEGTTVCLFFPVIEKAKKLAVERAIVHTHNLCGTESILIVEDERALGHFLSTVLRTYGYHPHCAETPSQALEVLERHREEIQLVISDVGLPEMDGFALCEILQSRKPELKVIIVSGNSDGTYKEIIQKKAFDAFIPKPYQAREILTTVRSLLDAR